jgi:hypothetical protein
VKHALLLLAFAGCGDDLIETPAQSGSRLKLSWYQTDDGARLRDYSIHDSERGDTCWFQTWNDGVTRCVNDAAFVGFSDPQCTQAVIVGQSTDLAGAWDQATCTLTSVYRPGAAVAATQWYSRTPTGCIGPYTSSGPLYAIGANLDRAQFAGLSTTGEIGDGRLRQIDYTSDGGFRILDEIHDTELATSCGPYGMSCQPSSTYDLKFLDAACTQRVTSIPQATCGTPAKYYAEQDKKCPDRTHYYTIGAVVQATKLYQLDGTTMQCMSTMPDANAQYHAIGAEVAPAALSQVIGDASGRRLQNIYFVGDSIAAHSDFLYDTELAILCYFAPATDGVARCLPSEAFASTYYSDPGCTASVLLTTNPIADPSCGPAPPAPQFVNYYTNNAYEVRVVTGPYTGAVYSGGPGSCTQLMMSDAYTIGGIAAPESFVAATTVTDP